MYNNSIGISSQILMVQAGQLGSSAIRFSTSGHQQSNISVAPLYLVYCWIISSFFHPLVYYCILSSFFHPLVYYCILSSFFHPLVYYCILSSFFHPLVYCCILSSFFHPLVYYCILSSFFHPLVYYCILSSLWVKTKAQKSLNQSERIRGVRSATYVVST